MAKTVIFLPRAIDDARLAYQWYEENEVGLGGQFLLALSDALTFVASNPSTPRLVFRNYRRVLLRKFPYAVFYRDDLAAIHVFSVFHCSQDPKKWIRRLKETR